MKNHHLIYHEETSNLPIAIQAPGTPTTSGDAAPSHDAIARRAYEIFVEKGHRQGYCMQNWQQAEKELQNPGTALKGGTEACCDQPCVSDAVSKHSEATVARISADIKAGDGWLRVPQGKRSSKM